MESQSRFDGYTTTTLHGGPDSRRSQSFNPNRASREHGLDRLTNNSLGHNAESSSNYNNKNVSYDTRNVQNCDAYLYDNSSSRHSRLAHHRKMQSREEESNNAFKHYTNDADDDELAYASASLAYRREELEARLRGHSTIDSAGSNSIRNRQIDFLDGSTSNVTPTSDELMGRERNTVRNSLDVPMYNGASPLKRQYSTDIRWNGSRFVQQRSWDLHQSQAIVSHDPRGITPSLAVGNRMLSRSVDDSSIMPSTNLKSPHSTRKERLQRGVTYDEDGSKGYKANHQQPEERIPYNGFDGSIKPSVKDNQATYERSELIVRDFKPGYKNILTETVGKDMSGYSLGNEDMSVRNHHLAQPLTNSNNPGQSDPRMANPRQSKVHYDRAGLSYNEPEPIGAGGGVSEDMFVGPDYRHLLNPLDETQTPGIYRKTSKNGSIQWWKDQLLNPNSTYKESVGYNHYSHPSMDKDNYGSSTNRYNVDNSYPMRESNLPDVTVNVTGSQDYNALSNSKSFWSKFNPLGSKRSGDQYNTTIHASSIDGHFMDNNDAKSQYERNLISNYARRMESGPYSSGVSHLENNNLSSMGEGGAYINKNGMPITDQMNYPSMDTSTKNHEYPGFNAILDNQRQKGSNVSIKTYFM